MSSTPPAPDAREILRRNLRQRVSTKLPKPTKPPKPPKLISISGNIGAGKSTILKELRERGYHTISEGVDRGAWKNLLEKYYSHPEKFAFIFQTTILADMFEELAIASRRRDAITVSERSPVDTLAFASVIFENGHLSEEEFDVLKKLVSTWPIKPDVIFHLRLAPEACLTRIRQRARLGESKIELSYLERLEKFTTSTLRESQIPFFDIDVGSLTPKKLADKIEEMIDAL